MRDITPVKPSTSGLHSFSRGVAHLTERCPLQKHLYITRFYDAEHMWRCGDEVEPTTSDNSSREGSRGFTGTSSWEEALDFGLNGWDEGADNMRKVLRGVQVASAALEGSRRKIRADYHGPMLNMGIAMSGDPKCFRRRRTTRTKDGNHIRLAVSVSASCGVSTEAIMNRGAAACALVTALENEGYNVELICFTTTRSGGDFADARAIIEVPIKRPEDYLNDERVAMALANPSMLRRGMLAIKERSPEGMYAGVYVYGYGYPATLTEDEKAVMGYTYTMDRLEDDDIDWAAASHERLAQWVSDKWREIAKGGESC